MDLFGFSITRRASATPTPTLPRAWAVGGPVVREPYIGAWQRNEEIRCDSVLSSAAVWACVTQIAQDVGKLRLRLVIEEPAGVWTETDNPAYSPVLRKPNRYQTIHTFIEAWMTSKLLHGNTYVLKQRDARGVVVALYVLDPTRVQPLVATSGDVFYELRRDDLSGVGDDRRGELAVPAREIIHDTMIAPFHPLVGLSPIYACGLAALQGLHIQSNSSTFFANGSKPGGVITVPREITDDIATRIREDWNTKYSGLEAGRTAVLSGGMTYTPITIAAADAQLIEQLQWSEETVCACFHVPASMVGFGDPVPYANNQPVVQQYYSQCLQSLLVKCETVLGEGIGLGPIFGNRYGLEFDPDDLIWLDAGSKTKAAAEGIGSGGMSPDEARQKYYGLGPVPGGNTPYLQQQYFALSALAERDQAQPFGPPAAPTPPTPPPDGEQAAQFARALLTKMADLYAG